jgi:hypothetical protein
MLSVKCAVIPNKTVERETNCASTQIISAFTSDLRQLRKTLANRTLAVTWTPRAAHPLESDMGTEHGVGVRNIGTLIAHFESWPITRLLAS